MNEKQLAEILEAQNYLLRAIAIEVGVPEKTLDAQLEKYLDAKYPGTKETR